MPCFTLRTINQSFFTRAEVDRPDPDAALAVGIRGALMIATDEISKAATTASAAATVEVIVEDTDGRQLRRSAVSIAVAALAVGPVAEQAPPAGVNDY